MGIPVEQGLAKILQIKTLQQLSMEAALQCIWDQMVSWGRSASTRTGWPDVDIGVLARSTYGFSGANITKIYTLVSKLAIREAILAEEDLFKQSM